MPWLYQSTLLMMLLSSAAAADNEYLPVPANVSFAAVSELAFRDSDLTLSYGSEARQFGKLWLPASASAQPSTLLVLIHGGCWLSEFEIDHSFALSTGLAQVGYAVWSLEYRATGDPGGGWPGTFEDIIAGINYSQRLEDYGVSTENLAILGHSAGGHLALLAGSTQSGLTVNPDLVIGLAAITDVVAYAKGVSSCESATPAFLGGSIEQIPGIYLQANPASHVLHQNTYLLHGTADQIVPLSQAQLPNVETRMSNGASHFDWIHPGSPAFASLLELLDESF